MFRKSSFAHVFLCLGFVAAGDANAQRNTEFSPTVVSCSGHSAFAALHRFIGTYHAAKLCGVSSVV